MTSITHVRDTASAICGREISVTHPLLNVIGYSAVTGPEVAHAQDVLDFLQVQPQNNDDPRIILKAVLAHSGLGLQCIDIHTTPPQIPHPSFIRHRHWKVYRDDGLWPMDLRRRLLQVSHLLGAMLFDGLLKVCTQTEYTDFLEASESGRQREDFTQLFSFELANLTENVKHNNPTSFRVRKWDQLDCRIRIVRSAMSKVLIPEPALV